MYDKIDDFLKNFEVHNQEFIAGKTPVPVSGKVIDNLEKKLMIESCLDGWLTTGRSNERFQRIISVYWYKKCQNCKFRILCKLSSLLL